MKKERIHVNYKEESEVIDHINKLNMTPTRWIRAATKDKLKKEQKRLSPVFKK